MVSNISRHAPNGPSTTKSASAPAGHARLAGARRRGLRPRAERRLLDPGLVPAVATHARRDDGPGEPAALPVGADAGGARPALAADPRAHDLPGGLLPDEGADA